jgi:hypothetical protein
MPTYTVHAPPAGATPSDPERFRFVRDGFYFWAFLLGPLWLLYRRLWLALVGCVVVGALLSGVFYLVAASWWLKALGSLLFALLIGLEAGTLRRWTLTRRGWRMLGFVTGDDQEAAERRFFAEWVKRPAEPPPSTPQGLAAPVRRGPPSGSDVIGLFPEPNP